MKAMSDGKMYQRVLRKSLSLKVPQFPPPKIFLCLLLITHKSGIVRFAIRNMISCIFQRSSCKDCYTFCCCTGACPRCLRMDSGFKWKKSERDAWFSKHKHVCNLDWLCTVDKCSEVKDESKTHFLLCRFHIDKGRERVESFIEAIDSKFLPPSVRFYNNKPVNENDTG